jgi:hypothetical protein
MLHPPSFTSLLLIFAMLLLIFGNRLPSLGKSLGEANILAGGLCGMAQAAAWRWLRLGRPIAMEDAISQTLDLAWNGLSAVGGTASSPEADVLHLEDRIG